MTIGDALDLKAFMDTLPRLRAHRPATTCPCRCGCGGRSACGKRLYMDTAPFAPPPGADERLARGAYLVTGPGHCGECHTPRTLLGGPDPGRAFAGGPEPAGDGHVPNITPHEDGIGGWSAADIEAALRTGLLPGFETFGGSMVAVQRNMARLSREDREAIALYLLSLPPKPDGG